MAASKEAFSPNPEEVFMYVNALAEGSQKPKQENGKIRCQEALAWQNRNTDGQKYDGTILELSRIHHGTFPQHHPNRRVS